MSHDFLACYWHPADAGHPSEQPEMAAGQTAHKRESRHRRSEAEKHRTVGISMSPQLRRRAESRARALGLPLSRYVAWCVEAELEGRPPAEKFARV